MCNAYEQHVKWIEYVRMMQALELNIPTQQTELDLPQADDIRINQMGPLMRAAANDNAVELTPMNFGLPSDQPKRGPVFNFRSEKRSFADSRRCLVPASGFFEFTGTKYPKTKHRFTLNGAPFMAIAAIWREARGNHPASFAMLTTEPGPDVAPYHNRQVVVLRPQDWAAWIWLTRPEAELLRPLDAGSLAVETVRKGRDDASEATA
ncbi:SOS response-associated peptidase [Chelativorans sp. ZYF759]|uniref:SOS response-associated peptidase n=1 Tax=Chelativorans sp. ZYF759 TaxID=2692213 RepID=UPI00145E81BE|nr:SOS response-associated peptidase [Chelativorans sp. ZYF759]NMG41186.1 SOS response-associated peptidase [Chelativorans sp. ZYF759]